ncbi:PAS domain-containing sensor histidine kinase [Azospirillum halopraeferens]|uniref:PAS domain-containing sensor histidine kinase n=1 Tax=Azospirillum halopraeferens TaxID=34010 RepID=UPI000418BE90|nr:sensor histidine kinase [Azospirillum halopraeferens]
MTDPSQQKQHQNRGSAQRAAQDKIERLGRVGGPFVAAVEATRMPMVVTDPTIVNNPIIYANAAFLEMCGYDREEVLGQNYHFLGGENTDPEVARMIDTALGARQNINIEVQFYTKDGRAIWVAQQVSTVTDDQDRVVQHFSSFIDITHRKQAEDRLQRMTEDLERRVHARTKKLEEANERLKEEVERRAALESVLRAALEDKQEAVREKEFMIKEVNHRIKNTLQAAQSLLLIQSNQEDSGCVKDALQDAGQRLARLAEVHELLYQTEGYQTIDVSNYLETLCRGLLTSFRRDPDQVTLDVDAAETVWGPDLVLPLALIVNEVVSNALKYAFPQGRRGRICVELRCAPQNMYHLTIRDDGVGMPAKRRENSLGLKLVDMFAEQIGGSAIIKNEGGTIVTVIFPA